MNLIILTEADQRGEFQFTLGDQRALHIREILRAKPGETVEVGMLNGPVGTANVLEISTEKVVFEVKTWREAPGLSYEVDLICAVPRPKTLKKVLTVSSMMGVRTVQFVRANRADKSYLDSPLLLPENALPYLVDGLSQGKLTRLPKTYVHPLFRPFVEDEIPQMYRETDEAVKLLSEPSTDEKLPTVLKGNHSTKFVIAIGPEGGWVPFEVELLKKAGFRPFSLGPWMLRVESAVTAALAQLELVAGFPVKILRPKM